MLFGCAVRDFFFCRACGRDVVAPVDMLLCDEDTMTWPCLAPTFNAVMFGPQWVLIAIADVVMIVVRFQLRVFIYNLFKMSFLLFVIFLMNILEVGAKRVVTQDLRKGWNFNRCFCVDIGAM